MRLLVVTAVAAERDRAAAGLLDALGAPGGPSPLGAEPSPVAVPGGRAAVRCAGGAVAADVLAAGVGPAAAAAGTAAALAAAPYDLVLSAGIGGGFAGAPVGSLVVADAIVAADLGADSPQGFVPLDELGFGTSCHRPPPGLARRAADALGAACGAVLTVSTATGTAARAAQLTARHPTALAEGMEGFGVAEAAAAHGVPILEVRAISNAVGPRDRASWRIGDALAALGGAFTRLLPALERVGPTQPATPATPVEPVAEAAAHD